MRSILVCPDDFLWRLLAQTGPSHFEALYVVEAPQARARIAQRGGTVLAGDLERDAVYQRAFRTGHEPVLVAVDGPLLSQRLPDFFQIDLRVDRAWFRPWGTSGTLVLYIDLQNVINRKNAEGVTYNNDYSTRSYTNGLPIFPSIGVEYVP